jgi:hypothetical protein
LPRCRSRSTLLGDRLQYRVCGSVTRRDPSAVRSGAKELFEPEIARHPRTSLQIDRRWHARRIRLGRRCSRMRGEPPARPR